VWLSAALYAQSNDDVLSARVDEAVRAQDATEDDPWCQRGSDARREDHQGDGITGTSRLLLPRETYGTSMSEIKLVA
jgi:hypothetical protein